jgi:hypothetical protein
VILTLVRNPMMKLGLVVLFTGLFALCLALVTEARKVEIFATTSA